MSLQEIRDLLKKTSALRADREFAAETIQRSMEGCAALMKVILEGDHEIQVRGCWVLEIVLLNNPSLLKPNHEHFIQLIGSLTQGSAIRASAKVLATWCDDVYNGKSTGFPPIDSLDAERIANHCFTWLLDDHPVAVKVYSMEALFHLGKEIGWIHPELKAHLEQHYAQGSPAFQARARHLLKKL